MPKAKAKDDCLQREQLRLWFDAVRTKIQNRRAATAEKHYRVRPLDLLRMWHTKLDA